MSAWECTIGDAEPHGSNCHSDLHWLEWLKRFVRGAPVELQELANAILANKAAIAADAGARHKHLEELIAQREVEFRERRLARMTTSAFLARTYTSID